MLKSLRKKIYKIIINICRNRIDYSDKKCSIKNCKALPYRYFLCKKHFKKYVIDHKIEEILERNFINEKDLNFKLILLYLKSFFLHYIFPIIRVYYLEHFPNESLFLYHFKLINNNFYKKKISKQKFISQLQELSVDFNFPDNPGLFEINTVLSNFSIQFSKLTDYLFSKQIKPFLLKFKTHKILSVTFFSVLIIIKIFYLLNNDNLILFGTYKFIFVDFLFIYLIIFGWMSFGLKMIKSIDHVIKDCYNQKLYLNKKENNLILQSSLEFKSYLARFFESRMGFYGIFSAFYLFTLFKKLFLLKSFDIHFILISVFELILIFLAFVLLFYLLTFRRFTLEFNKFSINNINLNIYDIQKEFGIRSLVDFQRNFLIYNILSYFIVFIFIPVKFNLLYDKVNIIYIIIYFLSGLFFSSGYSNAIRNSLKMFKNIKEKIKKLKSNELARLSKLHFEEAYKKIEFLNNLKFFVFKKNQTLKTLKFIFLNICLPIIIVFICQNDYENITKFFVFFKNLILK